MQLIMLHDCNDVEESLRHLPMHQIVTDTFLIDSSHNIEFLFYWFLDHFRNFRRHDCWEVSSANNTVFKYCVPFPVLAFNLTISTI